MRALTQRHLSFGVIIFLAASALQAQAMRSETPARAMPRLEVAVGISQWQHDAQAGDSSGSWTRWGVTLETRGSVLGQRSLGANPADLIVGDYLDLSLGFYGATGKRSLRQEPTIRVPVQYGVQVGKLTSAGTQLVGRVGVAGGLGVDYSVGPFVGVRLKHRAIGVEAQRIVSEESTGSSVLLRWYPRGGREGANVALRYGIDRYEAVGLFTPGEGMRERTVTLLFSAERR